MGLDYVDLEQDIRQAMVAEIAADIASDSYYKSKIFTDAGHAAWPELLREAATSNDDDWLTDALRREGMFVSHDKRGSAVNVRDASKRHAQAQFNRYYMQAVCVVAMASGEDQVEVYRARESRASRSKSDALVGKRFPALRVLTELRQSGGIETDIGFVAPHSGISVRRVQR